uniref:Ig-like domain-containing protein n=1 Tax=Eptatretus burgeri TaxID=7764 RepID=A0A8C4NDJ5_EPTBU
MMIVHSYFIIFSAIVLSGLQIQTTDVCTKVGTIKLCVEREVIGVRGDDLILPCQLSHNEGNNIKDFIFIWYKFYSGKPNVIFKSSENVMRDSFKGRIQSLGNSNMGNGSVRIRDLKMEDQGMYKCRFEFYMWGGWFSRWNYDGFQAGTGKDTNVRVDVRPKILEVHREVMNSSTSWKLFCEAEVKPTPNISWRNPEDLLGNGSEILVNLKYQNELQMIITKHNITEEDRDGNYSCLIWNQLSVEKEFIFYKSLRPKILEIWNQLINSGTSWRLFCEAEAKPRPNITWWNPHGLLLNGSEIIMIANMENELHIISSYNITGEDSEGNYSCRVQNQHGVANGYIFYKSLHPKILHVWKEFITSSKSWRLFCEAEAKPGPKTTWWNPQGLLLNESETAVSPINPSKFQKIITTYNITDEDPEGKYSCVVRNQHGVAKEHVIYKSLRPKIFHTWKEFVSSSTSWRLFCEAKATPEPKITWWNPQGRLLNRSETSVSPINQSEFQKIFSSYNITGEDPEGNYSCVVRSQYGAVKGFVPYNSLRPKILGIWMEFLNSSKSWKLLCEAEAKPVRNITWWNPQERLVNVSKILVSPSNQIEAQKIITSYNITEEDPEGNYSCLVRNKYGAAKGFVFYKSLRPNILHVWREFERSNTSWRLFCKTEAKQRQNITWWNPQGLLLNGNDKLVIARDQNYIQEIIGVYNIKEEDPEGNYSCLVQNQHGVAKGFVFYKSMRPKILHVWREFLNSSNSWRLFCEAEAKPGSNITWWSPQGFINGSEIRVSSNHQNEFQKIISSYKLTEDDPEGNYSCLVQNQYGAVKESVFYGEFKQKSDAEGITGSVLGGSAASILILLLLLIVAWVYYIYKKQQNPAEEEESQGFKQCCEEEAFPMSPSPSCTSPGDIDKTTTPAPIQ